MPTAPPEGSPSVDGPVPAPMPSYEIQSTLPVPS